MSQRKDRDPATLRCDWCKLFTRHEFVKEQPLPFNPLVAGEREFIDVIYGCLICGCERAWGRGRPKGFDNKRKRESKRRRVGKVRPQLFRREVTL